MVVTPPVWFVIAVSRNRVISEYPAAVSAAVSTRSGIGVPANEAGGSVMGVAPSCPVCVMADSHSDGDVVGSPVAGKVCDRSQESTARSEPPAEDWVLMPLRVESVQNVGEVTVHGAAVAQARSSGASCRAALVVKLTWAAGVVV